MEVVGLPYAKRQRRKNDSEEKTQDLGVVRERAQYLMRLLNTAREASTEYREAVEVVAEQAGVDKPVLRAYIKARAGDDFTKQKRRSEQLTLLFEEVGGEISSADD